MYANLWFCSKALFQASNCWHFKDLRFRRKLLVVWTLSFIPFLFNRNSVWNENVCDLALPSRWICYTVFLCYLNWCSIIFFFICFKLKPVLMVLFIFKDNFKRFWSPSELSIRLLSLEQTLQRGRGIAFLLKLHSWQLREIFLSLWYSC